MEKLKYYKSKIAKAIITFDGLEANNIEVLQEIIDYSIENNDYYFITTLFSEKNFSVFGLKIVVDIMLQCNDDDLIFHIYKVFRNRPIAITVHSNSHDNISDYVVERKAILLSSTQYKFSNIKDIIFTKIKNPNNVDLAFLLSFEAKYILLEYEKIKFDDYPETDEILNILFKKKTTTMRHGSGMVLFSTEDIFWEESTNHKKFFTYVGKLLNSNKTILALYLLNNYSNYESQGDAKLWADKYIDAFVLLGRYDILSKYYTSFDLISHDMRYLQYIIEYFIKEKDLDNASKAIVKLKSIEPTHPYIKEALNDIENIHLINKMLSKNIHIEEIDTLNGKEFEDLLIKQFQNLGYQTTETPTTGDFGADIIIETENETRFIVQCKRFKSKVNLKAVQEVVGALAHFNGDIGIVITSSSFLNSAIKLAKSNDIELWEKNRLMKFLSGDISFSEISNS